jgi:hypothetical protein
MRQANARHFKRYGAFSTVYSNQRYPSRVRVSKSRGFRLRTTSLNGSTGPRSPKLIVLFRGPLP